MASDLDFEELVNLYYQPLYRFALSLTRAETDACDLTQQTFYVYQTKGNQLRDHAKVKAWLFTTMQREFLNSKRRFIRFPHLSLEQMDGELASTDSGVFEHLDTETVLEALAKVDEPHHAALALFYLEDYSYKEMAEILGIPIGTVKSRLARGISQLRQFLTDVNTLSSPAARKQNE